MYFALYTLYIIRVYDNFLAINKFEAHFNYAVLKTSKMWLISFVPFGFQMYNLFWDTVYIRETHQTYLSAVMCFQKL